MRVLDVIPRTKNSVLCSRSVRKDPYVIQLKRISLSPEVLDWNRLICTQIYFLALYLVTFKNLEVNLPLPSRRCLRGTGLSGSHSDLLSKTFETWVGDVMLISLFFPKCCMPTRAFKVLFLA